MKVSSALTVVSAAALASGSPVEKRAIGGVLLCTGPNSTGICDYKVYELNKCHQLSAPFHHNTSTFAPDGEAFSCFPRVTDCSAICMSPTGCTFGAVSFHSPLKEDLGKIQWNTLISSFDCSLNRTESS
ncbi:hypothetical protein L249_6418 [Ophiocordyceps polyrhachis-furcata BCC 54312]|uniref:Uncharacterized protein n=1 Tax=Ophiocordyceps polyrhachis-furcata BCC 54312 TaxID=1330021 RepID=A0A367LJN4_9HYPO|nr:hypothetical protein L249_6418 [Ophiocordyceps polyrhachis-furcata BCC 54312]